ncbi:hypothetical protein G3N59_06220 [Paraburkholderia sp. Ac-20340]|uniref:hypothetical protein n=1 Tax=Paraburkholderia sp. Ac-20340 TaxID=2703888 RepID=UPI00197FD815|nr:hypothetical protein [Paraburkholderia sp. Ac-20340]MBN3852971.1 hypothetical protein [Paraburkholderia sp. Ac-20340]
MKRILLCLAIGLTPLLAHAGCEDNFQKWTSQLHPGRTLDTEHAACKVWPANEALTIAALPLPQKNNNDDEGTDDLEVLVADTASGTVIAHQFQKSAISYDAVRFSGLTIDTARYQLTPQNRAFGVRVSHEGSSRVNPFGQTALSLYVVDGQSLRTVVDRLIVEDSGGEWDGNCAGDFSNTTRTLDLGPAGKEGYAVLKGKELSSQTTNVVRGGDCKYDINKSSKRTGFTLEYKNGKYGVPKGMQYTD